MKIKIRSTIDELDLFIRFNVNYITYKLNSDKLASSIIYTQKNGVILINF